MPVRLTDTYIKSLSAKKGARVEEFDSQEPGLHIRVSDQGRKTWFVRYRTADGRQPRFKLGTYPATSIADARDRARDAKKVVEAGGDPAADARRARAEAQRPALRTFGELFAAYMAACKAGTYAARGKPKKADTLDREQKLYDRHIKKALGSTPFIEIGRPQIKAFEKGMLAKGIKTQTNQAHALVRQTFSYAVDEELLPVNPAMGMASPAPKRARGRLLTDDELKAAWAALKDPSDLTDEDGERIYLGASISIALRLTAILLQRRVEVIGMREDELDLAQSLWVIPEERAKNGVAHAVPLPPAAVELIKQALKLNTRGGSVYVFPSPRSSEKPITTGAMTRALGSVMKALGFPLAGPHDLRRTGASALASERLGFPPFVVSQVLNHITDAGGGSATTRRHYNLYQYITEKRRALEAWEGLLLEIVGELVRPDNVTPFRVDSAAGG